MITIIIVVIIIANPQGKMWRDVRYLRQNTATCDNVRHMTRCDKIDKSIYIYIYTCHMYLFEKLPYTYYIIICHAHLLCALETKDGEM